MRALSIILILFSQAVGAADIDRCAESVSSAKGQNQVLIDSVEQDLKRKGISAREARGYAILIATMVASAAATTYVSSALPPSFQFVSHFLAQVSTLGVFVFGAPIWEPLSSGFRKMAFGVRSQTVGPGGVLDPDFEALWRRTQEHYSLNAQMSRNVINQFLISVHQNFYEAHRAIQSRNSVYAADQIAEAAFRLKTLFRDIDPEDPSVASAIRTAFTNHVVVDSEFVTSVFARIEKLDVSFASGESANYYNRLLAAWLNL